MISVKLTIDKVFQCHKLNLKLRPSYRVYIMLQVLPFDPLLCALASSNLYWLGP